MCLKSLLRSLFPEKKRIHVVLFLVFLMGSQSTLSSQIFRTFVAPSGETAYDTPSHWSPFGVPGSSDRIVFPTQSFLTRQISWSGDRTVEEIIFNQQSDTEVQFITPDDASLTFRSISQGEANSARFLVDVNLPSGPIDWNLQGFLGFHGEIDARNSDLVLSTTGSVQFRNLVPGTFLFDFNSLHLRRGQLNVGSPDGSVSVMVVQQGPLVIGSDGQLSSLNLNGGAFLSLDGDDTIILGEDSESIGSLNLSKAGISAPGLSVARITGSSSLSTLRFSNSSDLRFLFDQPSPFVVDGPIRVQATSGHTALFNSLSHTGGTTINSGAILELASRVDQTPLPTINGPITVNGELRIGYEQDATFSNHLSGSGWLVKPLGSNNRITVTGNNTHTGGTAIRGGILRVPTENSLGAATAPLEFSNNGGLQNFQGDLTLSAQRPINLSGNGFLRAGFNSDIMVDSTITGGGVLRIVNDNGRVIFRRLDGVRLTLGGGVSVGGFSDSQVAQVVMDGDGPFATSGVFTADPVTQNSVELDLRGIDFISSNPTVSSGLLVLKNTSDQRSNYIIQNASLPNISRHLVGQGDIRIVHNRSQSSTWEATGLNQLTGGLEARLGNFTFATQGKSQTVDFSNASIVIGDPDNLTGYAEITISTRTAIEARELLFRGFSVAGAMSSQVFRVQGDSLVSIMEPFNSTEVGGLNVIVEEESTLNFLGDFTLNGPSISSIRIGRVSVNSEGLFSVGGDLRLGWFDPGNTSPTTLTFPSGEMIVRDSGSQVVVAEDILLGGHRGYGRVLLRNGGELSGTSENTRIIMGSEEGRGRIVIGGTPFDPPEAPGILNVRQIETIPNGFGAIHLNHGQDDYYLTLDGTAEGDLFEFTGQVDVEHASGTTFIPAGLGGTGTIFVEDGMVVMEGPWGGNVSIGSNRGTFVSGGRGTFFSKYSIAGNLNHFGSSGLLRIGPGIGALTVEKDWNILDDSRYRFDLARTQGVPGTDWDYLEVQGFVTSEGIDFITLEIGTVSANGDELAPLPDFDPAQPASWTLIRAANGFGNLTGDKFAINLDEFANSFSGQFSVEIVPDPAGGSVLNLLYLPFRQVLNFSDWIAAQNFSSGLNGPLEDGNGDGITNLEAYAFGGDYSIGQMPILPRVKKKIMDDGQPYLGAEVILPIDGNRSSNFSKFSTADVDYFLLYSVDLVNWSDDTVVQQSLPNDGVPLGFQRYWIFYDEPIPYVGFPRTFIIYQIDYRDD